MYCAARNSACLAFVTTPFRYRRAHDDQTHGTRGHRGRRPRGRDGVLRRAGGADRLRGGGSDMIGYRRPIEGEVMAVLMTAQIPGGTQEMIDGMRPVLDQITSAKGFIVHGNGPSSGGWRVTEMWDTQADF